MPSDGSWDESLRNADEGRWRLVTIAAGKRAHLSISSAVEWLAMELIHLVTMRISIMNGALQIWLNCIHYTRQCLNWTSWWRWALCIAPLDLDDYAIVAFERPQQLWIVCRPAVALPRKFAEQRPKFECRPFSYQSYTIYRGLEEEQNFFLPQTVFCFRLIDTLSATAPVRTACIR